MAAAADRETIMVMERYRALPAVAADTLVLMLVGHLHMLVTEGQDGQAPPPQTEHFPLAATAL